MFEKPIDLRLFTIDLSSLLRQRSVSLNFPLNSDKNSEGLCTLRVLLKQYFKELVLPLKL